MLQVMTTSSAQLRDALVGRLGLIRNEEDSSADLVIYRKKSWILLFSTRKYFLLRDFVERTFGVTHMHILALGHSIDQIHEIGDVILPNVFFEYDAAIKNQEINKENRDSFLQKVHFIETYTEQKDFFVENFGLSIGGIAVALAPEDPDISEKLMLAYEADVYTSENLFPHFLGGNPEFLDIFLIGIMQGKQGKYKYSNVYDFLAANFVTTIKFIQQDN